MSTMDRLYDPAARRQLTLRRWFGAALIATGVGLILARLPQWLAPHIERSAVRFDVVDAGPVRATIEASGRVVPAFEAVGSSPVEARVVRIRRRPGDRLAAGDPVVELDPTDLDLALARLEERVAQQRTTIASTRLDNEREQAALDARLASLALDVEMLTWRREQKRKLFAAGLLIEEAVRESEVAVRKAEIDRDNARRSRDIQARSAAGAIAALARELTLIEAERTSAAQLRQRTTARAERPGVVTWVVPEEGALVRRGDVLFRVADLDGFRVEATLSDVHASSLAPGQPVELVLADGTLDGRVESIDPTIAQGAVRFTVDLGQHRADPRLRDSLRVDVHVITGTRERATRLGRGGWLRGGGPQQVLVVRGDRAVRTGIEIGLVGRERVEVINGLREGDEVIVSNVDDWSHLDVVRVR